MRRFHSRLVMLILLWKKIVHEMAVIAVMAITAIAAILTTLLSIPCPAAIAAHKTANQQEKQNAEEITPQDAEYSRLNDPSFYIGADVCKSCHEDLGTGFERGPHRKNTLSQRQGPQWQGCEACHGPGKLHADSTDPDKIIRFPSLSQPEASRRCLGCHALRQEHASFMRSPHMKNNVGCVDCHSIHHPNVEQKLLKTAQPALCLNCHAKIKSDSRPFHQTAADKPIVCTTCHNPHGLARTR